MSCACVRHRHPRRTWTDGGHVYGTHKTVNTWNVYLSFVMCKRIQTWQRHIRLVEDMYALWLQKKPHEDQSYSCQPCGVNYDHRVQKGLYRNTDRRTAVKCFGPREPYLSSECGANVFLWRFCTHLQIYETLEIDTPTLHLYRLENLRSRTSHISHTLQ